VWSAPVLIETHVFCVVVIDLALTCRHDRSTARLVTGVIV
jgi:hypothetical protein